MLRKCHSMELDWTKLGEYMAATAAIATGLSVIWKYFLTPLWKAYILIKNVIQKIDTALPVLYEISEQFKPNGGNSLRDVLNRLESSFLKIHFKTKIIFNHLSVGIFECDPDGKCVWVNNQWLHLSGMTLEESQGNGWVLAIHPEDRDEVFAEWTKSMVQNRDFDLYYRFISRAGEITNVHGISGAVKDGTGRIVSHIGCVTPDSGGVSSPPRSKKQPV